MQVRTPHTLLTNWWQILGVPKIPLKFNNFVRTLEGAILMIIFLLQKLQNRKRLMKRHIEWGLGLSWTQRFHTFPGRVGACQSLSWDVSVLSSTRKLLCVSLSRIIIGISSPRHDWVNLLCDRTKFSTPLPYL